MAKRLQTDPNNLRALADRHDQAAAIVREAGKIPHDWLSRFQSEYGTIAEPVRAALTDYFDRRHRRAERQAARHEQSRDILRVAATSFEDRDQEYGQRIGGQGAALDGAPSSSGPLPVVTAPTAGPHGPSVSRRAPSTPETVPADTRKPQRAESRAVAPATNSGNAGVQDTGRRPVPAALAETGAAPAMSPGRVAAAAAGLPPPLVGSTAGPGAISTGAPTAVPGRPSGAPPAAGKLTEVLDASTKLPGVASAAQALAGAASGAGGERRAIGEAEAPADDSDVTIARKLLASILHAAGTTRTVRWAVAVLESPVGPTLFVTTNEGRGWLPPGLYLPRKVSMPWLWDEAAGIRPAHLEAWERCADPARILVDFARIWGPHSNSRLTALAVSGHIDPRLRTEIPEVAVAEQVSPANDMDLRRPGPYTVDRLGLAGSAESLDEVLAVPPAARAACALELATEAHDQLRRAVPTPVAAVVAEQLRERILALLEAGERPPKQWWDELRQADSNLAEVIESRLSVDGEAVRSMVFERRCNELVLLLDGESGYRRLRNQFFAFEQVVNHPSLTDQPAITATLISNSVPPPAISAHSLASDGVLTPGVDATHSTRQGQRPDVG